MLVAVKLDNPHLSAETCCGCKYRFEPQEVDAGEVVGVPLVPGDHTRLASEEDIAALDALLAEETRDEVAIAELRARIEIAPMHEGCMPEGVEVELEAPSP